ncbi:hypothetical protein IU500_34260 [Nocardia terpenica]|uniref:Uncharacterized protein n=1 Tax=Nocardia terpenica TaxID=455432 RepID=A0A164H605_9NOCA|nr:DUF6474 family protein [Nocardia terpenica]KZM68229.1 hypothetical protein AWN90_09945 [Nocardia terpenica]MBF6065992.1 hypothetical protein [Nocardia terpenica]MBF6109081.1 hypothetical protein [Nocardia terpenica]MBF6116236.1 hypothetical protein [Nocardia terpenica]MBF6123237.1 hypothetical protein [Nocardia terpenica]
MGLFTKRKRRSDRKAEAKALKHKATLEAKLSARNERKRDRAEARTRRDVAKQQVATLKAEEKAALKRAERAERELLSAGQIKKYLGAARVLIPVLAPLAYRAATFIRGQIDTRRAHRLGIGLDQLGDFSGHGARLQARIAGTEATLADIEKKAAGDAEAQKFASATRDRLDSLTAAVRTAEQMPAGRRRAVHASISDELSGVEADLLARLGVR